MFWLIAGFFQRLDNLFLVFYTKGFQCNLQFHCCTPVSAKELIMIQLDHIAALVSDNLGYADQFTWLIRQKNRDGKDSVPCNKTILDNR